MRAPPRPQGQKRDSLRASRHPGRTYPGTTRRDDGTPARVAPEPPVPRGPAGFHYHAGAERRARLGGTGSAQLRPTTRGPRIRVPTVRAGQARIDALNAEPDRGIDELVARLAGDGTVNDRRRVRAIMAGVDLPEVHRALDLREFDRRLDSEYRARLAQRRRLRGKIKRLLADPDIASARDVEPQLQYSLGLLARGQPSGPGAPRDENAAAFNTLLRLAGVARREDRAFVVALLRRGERELLPE